MSKKLLLSLIIAFSFTAAFAQPLAVSNIFTAGRFNTCGGALPGVSVNFVSGTGSHVNASGALVIDDPCDTTVMDVIYSGLKWNQSPNINWIHSYTFAGGNNFAVTSINPSANPSNWSFQSLGCTGTCPNPPGGAIFGSTGYYYEGPGQSCCPVNNPTFPCDNYGDGSLACGTPFSFNFRVRLCNSGVIAANYFVSARGDADGNTGCWTFADATSNIVRFSIAAVPYTAQLFTPTPAATTVVKNCVTNTYSTTLTGGCGNTQTVSWWTLSSGGVQIGTGSPFVYSSATCMAGNTVYAQCCPTTSTCLNRRAVGIPNPCPLTFTTAATSVDPTCAVPTGSITVTPTDAAPGTITYTLNPGGVVMTGAGPVTFGGLAPGGYTITAVDAAGCTSTSSATINTATTGGPGPVVTTPINYCVGDPATQLTAPGTNLLWYTTATGGTGNPVAPTPSTVSAGTTTYYVSQNPTGTCESARSAIVVNVNATSTITLTSAAGTNNQTVCINAAITNIVYTTGAGATGASVAGLPAGVNGVYSGGTNGTFTISGNPTATGTFNYTVTTSGGCGAATATGTIVVNALSTITLTSAPATTTQIVCINTAITNITYSTANGVTGAAVTGLPAGVTGVYGAGGIVTISGTPSAAGTFNYTVTTSGGCTPPTATGTIIVNPASTITLTSAPATTSQSVCINTAITNITYSTTGGITGATVAGLPAGVNGVYSGGTNGTVTISGTPSSSGTFNYTITTTGGCAPPTATGSITVNANVSLTLTSAPATANQTVNVSTPITNITYTAGSGATGISVTGLPAGVTGTVTGTGLVISGSPTIAGTYTYTVSAIGGCSTSTLTGTIIVNDLSGITLTSAAGTDAQTVCINTAIVNIVYTTSGGATGASITAGALPAGLTGSYSGGTNGTFNIIGTPTAAGTFNYTITTSGGVGTASVSGSVTVNPNVTMTLTTLPATTSQTVCINTGIAGITYQTGSGATGASITAGALPAGVTGSYSGGTNGTFTITGNPSVAGTFNYTVTTSGGCGTVSLSGTITVNPVVTMTLTSPAATSTQTVCVGTAILSIQYTTADGATGASATGLPAGVTGVYSGGTNGTYTITGNPTAIGTANYTVTTSGGCPSATLSGTITVNPNVTMTLTSPAGSDAQTICINTLAGSIVYTTANGATGASITTGALPAGMTGAYSGGTNGTFNITGTPTAAGTFNYTVTTSGGCSSVALSGTITVSPASTITLTSLPATAAQTLCVNNGIAGITYSTANGVTNVTASGLPVGVTAVYSGGTNGNVNISGSPTTAGTYNYLLTTTGGCGVATLGGTITVNPDVTMTLTSPAGSDAQTICINTLAGSIVYSTTNGVTGVSISSGALPAGMTGNYSGGTNGTFTISGTPTAAGTFNYTVTTSGGCSSVPLSGTITVSTATTLTLTSLPATASQTVCITAPITNIVYAVGGGGTGAFATGLPAGVTGAFATGAFTISGNPSVAGTFNYTVTTTGGCGVATLNGTITVNPNATISLSSAVNTDAQTVCVNTAITNITYAVADGATGASITAGALPAGVTGSFSGTTFTITGNPTATGTFNYTVTTSGGCSSAFLTGTITVNPDMTLTLTSGAATSAQSVCINSAINTITYSPGSGATGAAVTGLPAGVNGTFAAGILTIDGSPSASGTFNYTVNATGGCGTASLTGSITVSAAATMTLTSPAGSDAQTVCINTGINTISYTAANGATGVSITAGALPGGVTGSFSGGVFTIAGTPNASGTFNYTVTTTGGCGTVSLSGSITVNANVTMTLTSAAGTDAQTGCINTLITPIAYTTADGATGASITSGSLPAGVTGAYSGGTNGIFTISGTPTVSGTFNYTVTTSGGCSSVFLSGSIVVNPATTITLTSAPATTSQALCENTAITNISYSTANGATGVTVTGLPTGVTGLYTGTTNGTFTISGTPATGSGGIYNYTVTTTGGCGTATLSGSINVVAIPAAPGVVTPVRYCPGDASVPLTATGTNLLWYNSATGGSGSALAPTPSTAVSGSTFTYWVSQSTTTASCESPRSQIDVIVNNPLVINIGNDTTICQGDTARFTPSVTPAATSYQWRLYTGTPNSILASTINTINGAMYPSDTSRYILRATFGGCSAEDTVQVNVRWKPKIEAGANAAICLDRSNGVNSVVLTASVSHISAALGTPNNYGWTPTDSLSTPLSLTTNAYPTNTTWYFFTDTLTVANYGCDFIVHDSVKVVVQPVVHAFAGNDTIGVLNALHRLHGTGGSSYLWSAANPSMVITHPASQNADVMLTGDGNFYLQVRDAIGCVGYDSIFVQAFAGPTYLVPNAFSPNGDGLNDIFRAIPPGISTTTYFRVFNRLGELLFETNQYLKGWDGTYKGKPQPNGVYVWSVKGVDRNHKTVEMQGTVTIVR